MASVSANPWGFVILPILFVLAHRWPKHHGRVLEDSRVGIFRRLGAFYIDMSVSMFATLPVVLIVWLATEYVATGQWQWSYERDFFRWTDIIDISAMLLGFYGMFYYQKWHFYNNRQTLGQHIFKFKLLPLEGQPNMTIRALVAGANLSWWPIWPWTIFKGEQDQWWDTASNIKARRVMPSWGV